MSQLFDNIKSNVDEENIEVYERPFVVRRILKLELKEGVDTFYNPFTFNTAYVDTGLSTDVDSEEQPTTQYVTLVLEGDTDVNTSSQETYEESMSRFLSQLKRLNRPLPGFCFSNGNLKVESENFEAKEGIFDAHFSMPTFEGSTFKKAPKIYSDEAMSNMIQFPYFPQMGEERGSGWEPFRNCDNLEEILPQGTLDGEKLQLLSRCSFEYIDDYGISHCEAWPKVKGVYNGNIFCYIDASYISLSTAPIIFEELGPNVSYVYKPWHAEALVIDYQPGGYHLPLFGLTFEKCENMKRLTLDDTQFLAFIDMDGDDLRDAIRAGEVDADNEKNLRLNLQFSYSSLGIQAPQRCEHVEGLHTLFAHYYKGVLEDNNVRGSNVDMNLVTAGTIGEHGEDNNTLDNAVYLWGASLGELWNEDFQKDKNNVPLLPEGVKFLDGYYHKVICGDNVTYTREKIPRPYDDFDTVKYGTLGDWKKQSFDTKDPLMCRTLKKNGKAINVQIPDISNKLAPTPTVRNYARNLYAHEVIVEDITIPPLPTDTKHKSLCYVGTFAYAQGTKYEKVTSDNNYLVRYFWSNSKYENSYEGYKTVHSSRYITDELREILDNNITNSFKIRQTQGLTVGQREGFVDNVDKVYNDKMAKDIKSLFVGGGMYDVKERSIMGASNMAMRMAQFLSKDLKNFKETNEYFKEHGSSYLNEVGDAFFDKLSGTHSQLVSVYRDYPNTVPNSNLEWSFKNADELELFIALATNNGVLAKTLRSGQSIKSRLESLNPELKNNKKFTLSSDSQLSSIFETFNPIDEEKSSIRRYVIDKKITVKNNAKEELEVDVFNQYRFAYMSELDLERADIVDTLCTDTPKVRGFWSWKEAYYVYPLQLRMGDPVLVCDSYVETKSEDLWDYSTRSEEREAFEKKHKDDDNPGVQRAHYICIALSRDIIATEDIDAFKYEVDGLLKALPEGFGNNEDVEQEDTIASIINPATVSTDTTKIREALDNKGYSKWSQGAIGDSLSLGDSVHNGKNISIRTGEFEEHTMKASAHETYVPTTPKIKKIGLGQTNVVNNVMFALYGNRLDYQTVDLEGDIEDYMIN